MIVRKGANSYKQIVITCESLWLIYLVFTRILMMNKLKNSCKFKWRGGEVECGYKSSLFTSGSFKFYNSFVKDDTSYSAGDYAFINDTDDEVIGWLKCLFEDSSKKCKAIILTYEFAKNFKKNFAKLNIDFDETNEVVLKAGEVVLNLDRIGKKCRVINGAVEDTVENIIDANNLNATIYFLCRFQLTGDGKFVSALDNIKWEHETEIITISPEKTPSRCNRGLDSNKRVQILKNICEEMDTDDSTKNHIEHVRRNLNESFNDSQSDQSLTNYSIVEQNDDLKIRLKVLNGKVVSKIPNAQPVVLLDNLNSTPKKKPSVIYEMKSPTYKNPLTMSVPAKLTNLRRSSRRVSFKEPAECCQKDLSSLVQNLKIHDKSPSPRKLRRTTRMNYAYSSESEDENLRRKSTRSSTKLQEFSPKKLRRTSVGFSEFFIEDSDDDAANKNSTKRARRTTRSSSIVIEEKPPVTPRNRRLSKLSSPKKDSTSTPKRCTPSKLLREGLLTPSMDQRRKSVVKPNTPLVLARSNLHVSYVPTTLPCREKEYEDIYNFIEGKLLDKCGGCMYISGVPGTGKTATVTSAIGNLIEYWKRKDYPEFKFISVNGMKLTEPRQCYVEILNQLTGKRKPWEQALESLEEKFTKKSGSKKTVPTVLLVDELDILCTKRQDVVYNLLDWPTKPNAQLIVITIANTMDLPERLLMSRVTSRLGLTRLTFQAYTHKQLQEIVLNRLSGNNSFKSDAVQFVARKVASVSGDARRALDICRRSAEIAETEGPDTKVTMNHVNAALEAMLTQPKIKAISHCSKLEKLILQSVIAEVERTGVEETNFNDVYVMLTSLAALEGFKMVSVSIVSSAIYRLNSCKLLLAEQKCVNIYQKIILNVSSDDVYYALKNNS